MQAYMSPSDQGLVRPGRKVVLDGVMTDDVNKKKMHIWYASTHIARYSQARR
jgi:hypothetical protein